MAGSRLSKPQDEATKKRKRDLIEGDARIKRSRAQQGVAADEHEQAADGDVETDNSLQNGSLANSKSNGEAVAKRSSDGEAGWRLSKPMGGRMLDIDPILTQDDQ
jgi:NET1-associated nuclear protein 1 (U3 small nucleolar RNA-associated protein 17)